MKTVLLTGGTGFVGANLARRLLRDGHSVHLLLRPGYRPGRIDSIRDDVRPHVIAPGDPSAVTRLVGEVRPEWIFHLAAHGAYSWQNDARQIFEANLTTTVNLLEACLATGFEAFVHTGSSSEYGFKDHAPAETESLDPNSSYACAKAAATLYCRQAALSRDAHIVTLRLYSAFGPYEDPGRLMPKLIEHGLKGGFPPLVNPETARDFIYVEDVCDACVLAAARPCERGGIYNLGTGVQTTLREVVEVARRTFGITAEPRWDSMPARSWDTSVWVANSRKIRAELGWEPRFHLERGFLEMVKWSSSN